MGSHRAERAPRRAASVQRTPRKPLTRSAPSRRASSPASAEPATGYVGKRIAAPVTDAPAAPVEPTTGYVGKRIAAPAAPTVSKTTESKRSAPKTTKPQDSGSKHTGSRGALFKGLPSVPVLAGVAALAISTGGALNAAASTPAHTDGTRLVAASSSTAADPALLEGREEVVSRDSRREDRAADADQELQAKAEAMTEQRNQTLQTLTVAAEKQAAKIEANQWVLPVKGYRLSATFGMSSYLWSTVHTGLDFSAPIGSPLYAVANATVTEVGYDGSYGNKTVLTLEDGTEIWYCHQTTMDVLVGQQVVGGDVIGTVGSTGNSTGPHVHIEVRPGGGGPIDPYGALLEHGLQP